MCKSLTDEQEQILNTNIICLRKKIERYSYKEFINREVVINYIQAQVNKTGLPFYIVLNAFATRAGDDYEELIKDIITWMSTEFGNAKFFHDSDCPARAKTGFKRLGGLCTYSDILRLTESQIKRLRFIGDATFEQFNSWFEKQGYELFTEYDLKVLDHIAFNFYGETRTVDKLRSLGIKETTLRKVEKNKMIWSPRYKFVNERDIMDTQQKSTQQPTKQKAEINENGMKQKTNTIQTAVVEVNMSPDKVVKYLAMGIGEEIKQQMNSELIASHSERLIRQRIMHNALEMTKQQPKVKKVELKQKGNITRDEICEIFEKNPKLLYSLDEKAVKHCYDKCGDDVYDFVMTNNCLTTKEKLDLIDYVRQIIVNKDCNLKF